MQTTVNVPDSLYRKSEAVAASRGTTVQNLIVEAIAKEVECARETGSTFGGKVEDLPVIRSSRPGTLDLSGFNFDDLLT